MILFGLTALQVEAHAEDPPTATVTVTAKKEAVVKKLDKTVYNVSDAPRAANGTAQDVLQSTPEVSVTADGQISVKGNPKVTVLVDGKPTAMISGSDDERAVALQVQGSAADHGLWNLGTSGDVTGKKYQRAWPESRSIAWSSQLCALHSNIRRRIAPPFGASSSANPLTGHYEYKRTANCFGAG